MTEGSMNYGGLISISTVDWFGISTCVIFFRGCSLGCNTCQNRHIISGEDRVSLDKIKTAILLAKPFISGVTFTGGEPCQQVDVLITLVDWCKCQGLKTYLHTSGNFPENLKKVISKLDGVRIDFKPMEQFSDGETKFTDRFSRYVDRFVESVNLAVQTPSIEYWVASVALQVNRSLEDIYIYLTNDPKHILIVQGNEESPRKVSELKKMFPGCYLYSREEGLVWNKPKE